MRDGPWSLRSGPCSRVLASSSVALNPGHPSTPVPIATHQTVCAKRVTSAELEYSSHQSWSVWTPYRPGCPCEISDPASGRQVPPLITCRPLNHRLIDLFLKLRVLYVQLPRILNVSCALCQRAADGILFSPMHLLPRPIPILLHPNEQVDLVGYEGCSYACRILGGITTRTTD
ncbi:hypothetical protein EDB80DRAFT_731869 [Ilyonectria destructans]|nr:hypothetical protein EDB80DRAFT_731869 [Ilyonectria destructans]